MRDITVKPNQSLFDIAIQEYGNIEGVFHLVEDNESLTGITDNVFAGEVLKVRDNAINKRMVEFLRPHEIATVKDARGEGIGYMRVGIDFIVR